MSSAKKKKDANQPELPIEGAPPATPAAKPAKKAAAPEFKLVLEPKAMDLLKATSARLAAAKSMSFTANVDATRMLAAMAVDVGDFITITETQTGLSPTFGTQTRGYFVNEVQMQIPPGRGLTTVTYGLSLSNQTPAWELGTVGASELDQTTVVGL